MGCKTTLRYPYTSFLSFIVFHYDLASLSRSEMSGVVFIDRSSLRGPSLAPEAQLGVHGRPASLRSPLLSCSVPLAHHSLPSSVLSQNFAPDLLARTVLPAGPGVAGFSSSLSFSLRAILSQSPSWALKEATPAATPPPPPRICFTLSAAVCVASCIYLVPCLLSVCPKEATAPSVFW